MTIIAEVARLIRSDKSLMAISTFTRLGSNMLVSAVFARFLGPDGFALVGMALAYSSVLNLIADFGLGTFALQEVGARPHLARVVMRATLKAKLITVAAAALAGLVILAAVRPSAIECVIYFFIFAAAMIASIADLSFVVSRVTGRYDRETGIVVITSIISLVVTTGVVYVYQEPLVAAIVYILTRGCYFLTTVYLQRNDLFAQADCDLEIGVSSVLRRSMPLAIDTVLSNLTIQIDGVLAGFYFSGPQLAIYLASSKLLQATAPFASILSIVGMPRLAYLLEGSQADKFVKEIRRVGFEFISLATAVALGFGIFGRTGLQLIYGNAYITDQAFWTAASIFIIIRYTTPAFGLQLLIFRFYTIRNITLIIALLGSFLFAYLLNVPLGLTAIPLAMAGSSLLVLIVYSLTLMMRTLPLERLRRSNVMLASATAGVIVFLAFFLMIVMEGIAN